MGMSGPASWRRAARGVVDRVSAPIGSTLGVAGVEGVVTVTFDDGPDPTLTPQLLRVLAEAEAGATFFMLGSRVRRFADVAHAVVAAGHEVALHGLDHRRLTSLPRREAFDSITSGKAELEDALGVEVRWFRPPYGAHNLRIWRHVRSLGMQMVLWGPSLHDWTDLPAERRWAGARALAGDIVLGHDGLAGALDGVDDPPPPDLDRAEWARQVLAAYRDAGLRSVTLSEALASGRPIRGARWTR